MYENINISANMDINMDTNINIKNELFKCSEKEYQKFQASLIPNIDKNTIIGVRSPIIKAMGKRIFKKSDWQKFIMDLPHNYHEENLLHFFIISQISDYELCKNKINDFLPYITNWAVCDQSSPKIFKNNHKKLINDIKIWINSEHLYTSRFGMRMLMNEFLDGDFKIEYLSLVGNRKTEEYYLQMMKAWYFATALAKQYTVTLDYLKHGILDTKTLKMTISKAKDSYRISQEHKTEIANLAKINIKNLFII